MQQSDSRSPTALGGTWDLMRYPGIRSDSDMYTFGYNFRPWPKAISIASGGDSHWRDCHFADALPPSRLKHRLEVEGGCSRMTEVSPTAQAVRSWSTSATPSKSPALPSTSDTATRSPPPPGPRPLAGGRCAARTAPPSAAGLPVAVPPLSFPRRSTALLSLRVPFTAFRCLLLPRGVRALQKS